MPIMYERHRPVSSGKKYIITSLSYESSGRISVGVKGNSRSNNYHLKFINIH